MWHLETTFARSHTKTVRHFADAGSCISRISFLYLWILGEQASGKLPTGAHKFSPERPETAAKMLMPTSSANKYADLDAMLFLRALIVWMLITRVVFQKYYDNTKTQSSALAGLRRSAKRNNLQGSCAEAASFALEINSDKSESSKDAVQWLSVMITPKVEPQICNFN